jgi:hypothetical protein
MLEVLTRVFKTKEEILNIFNDEKLFDFLTIL